MELVEDRYRHNERGRLRPDGLEGVSQLAVGDVRDIQTGVRLGTVTN